MRLRLLVFFLAAVCFTTRAKAEGCIDQIPADLLPIFLEETAHVPDWREAICAQIKAGKQFPA